MLDVQASSVRQSKIEWDERLSVKFRAKDVEMHDRFLETDEKMNFSP